MRGQELPAWIIQALQAGQLRFDIAGNLRGTRRSLPPILRALDDWQAQFAQKEKKTMRRTERELEEQFFADESWEFIDGEVCDAIALRKAMERGRRKHAQKQQHTNA